MKLSLLIPVFKASHHLKRNLNMWKKLASLANLIFIEDSIKEESKKIVKQIGGEYFSKQNGNWGSVINFAQEHKVIKTKYMTVFDPDDEMNIKDFILLISLLEDKDIYVTNQITQNFITKKQKIEKPSKNIFLHYSWFKTSLFYKISKLPENISYTDTILMAEVLSVAKSIKFFNLSPYIYNENVDGQSMILSWNKLKSQLIRLDQFKSYAKNIDKGYLWKYQKRSLISAIYVKYFLMINVYRVSSNVDKKEIMIEVKKIKWFKRPITTWLVWSKLERMFRK